VEAKRSTLKKLKKKQGNIEVSDRRLKENKAGNNGGGGENKWGAKTECRGIGEWGGGGHTTWGEK